MDGINFLNEEQVIDLFSENENVEKEMNNSGNNVVDENNSEDNVEKISDQEAAMLFDNGEPTEEVVEEHEQPIKREQPQNQPTETLNLNSITKQLANEDIFANVSDEQIENVKSVEDFRNLIETAIHNGLTEQQRRISEAMDAGVPNEDITDFEETIKFLHAIKKEDILAENEDGDNLRKRLILQDYINNGKTTEEAVEIVKKIFDNGDDINYAEKALKRNKEYFQQRYKQLVEEGKQKVEENNRRVEEQTAELKSKIMNSGKFLGEIDLDERTKRQAVRNLSEAVYKDKQTGEMITAIQQYQRNNKTEFLKNIGILFTITDGFKSMDKLFTKSVNRRVNREIENIENVLKGNSSNTDRNLELVTSQNRTKSPLEENWLFDN